MTAESLGHAPATGLALNGDPAIAFYRRVMQALREAHVPFLVGGAYALTHYTGFGRETKDFDLFLRRTDLDPAREVLEVDAGCRTEVTFGHWLAKAFSDDNFVDLIFSSGNGEASVDDEWFEHATPAEVLGERVLLTPAEEMLWSKAFVMERERFDGGDVAHLIRGQHATLDWTRLVRRFGSRWRILLGHLILFGFIYPGERAHVPPGVMDDLLARLRAELECNDPHGDLCQGTIISRQQYLPDLATGSYTDARVAPTGPMTPEEIRRWTEAIGEG